MIRTILKAPFWLISWVGVGIVSFATEVVDIIDNLFDKLEKK